MTATAGVYDFGGPLSPRVLPPKVRWFGRYPNTGDWLPADLLLISPLKPNFSQKWIIQGHLDGGYDQEDARWHHAAIYLTDGDICEAQPSGVRYTSLNIYVDGNYLIRVRRDFSLEPDQRWRIALRALSQLKSPYSVGSMFDLFWLSRNGFDRVVNAINPKKGAYICSQLYANAYSPITGKVLQNPKSGEVTPGFLSSTGQLRDIEVHWLSI